MNEMEIKQMIEQRNLEFRKITRFKTHDRITYADKFAVYIWNLHKYIEQLQPKDLATMLGKTK